jgi:hypothetical protein
MRRATLLATAALLSPALAPADIIHVPDDYPTIQAALSAATDGDEVVVAPGTYTSRLTMGPVSVVPRSGSGDPTDTILDDSWYTTETLLPIVGDAPYVRRVEGSTFRNAPRAILIAIEAETGVIRIVSNRDAVIDRNLVALGEASGIIWQSFDLTLTCNDSFGNTGLDYTFLPSTGGNLSVDPLFCNAGAGNYTLEESSMCLPGQNARAVQIGALGQGCDTTPVTRTSWGALKGRHR